MTVFDRAAVWLFVSVLGALFVLLELGIIGPRWRLFCDGKPCGTVDPSETRIDLPKTDAGMHTFEASRTTGSGTLNAFVHYTWQGADEATTGSVALYGGAMPYRLVVTSHRALQPVALSLDGLSAPPRLQLLFGSAVPTGGQRIALRGRPWRCDKSGCVEGP